MNKVALTALSLVALSSAAYARDSIFVAPEQSHTLQILSKPPAAGSATTKSELEELHKIEASRSEADIEKAKFDDENENIFAFKSVFGDKFTKENLPLTDIFALTLIDMVPEKRDEILARADEYAHNRLVCGVHYATDLLASKLSAYTIHAIMDVNPQFQAELHAAKTELRAILSLPTN